MSQPSNRRRGRRASRTATPLGVPPQPALSDAQDPQQDQAQAELPAQAAAPAFPGGVAVGDQVARAAQDAALAAGDVVLDPFVPTPLDPATLAGTPVERLAQVEAALRAADAHAGRSVRAAKVRWTIEKGTALAILVEHDLYTAAGFTSLDAYATEVLHISRDNVYKTIEAAAALRAVLDAERVSKIFYTPPNVSQAKALAPLLALDAGEDKAVKVVTEVQAGGKKLTAAAIIATAVRLGYTTSPAQIRAEELDDGKLAEKVNAKLAAAADAAERALALYDEALALDVEPAERARADADLARLAKASRILAKYARHSRT
ncbi:hypothetical protein ABT117_33005 [Streptomyces sp. NPDC002262]|uniref:hypothetical protein n=1 Tax=Streptomyces sp. NPDC002262 TaxID=3154414 RepID=UPI0033165518